MLVQPGGDLAGGEDGRDDLEALHLRRGGAVGPGDGDGGRAGQAVGEGRVEAVAQHLELEGVEELVDRVAVPAGGRQFGRDGADRLRRQVADQLGELAVSQYAAEVRAERVAGLALDLV